MKPMIYQTNRINPPEILVHDNYKGFDYYILNLGTHPCAYVEVSSTTLNGKNYDDIDLQCHGGLTYSHSRLKGIKKTGWYIGWDYAHYKDFLGCNMLLFQELPFTRNDKQWTTEEIDCECKSVIDDIVKLQKKTEKGEI